jgi:hypothetical protein
MCMYDLYRRTTLFDGNTNNDVNTGGFYWNLNNTTDNANQNIRTHSTCLIYFTLPCLLAKHMYNVALSVGNHLVMKALATKNKTI